MNDALILAENSRQEIFSILDEANKSLLGQFFTSAYVAEIMAGMLLSSTKNIVKILDPGAGTGILTTALIEHLRKENPELKISVTVIELDETLLPYLSENLMHYRKQGIKISVIKADFISWALNSTERFDIVIQNPPYRKLASRSFHDQLLKSHNIYVPNMYAAFMLLGVRLLYTAGQQVSITPRSWMNGTYYTNFRKAFLHEFTLNSIFTFESRSKVFADVGVLQESIITCGSKQCHNQEKLLILSSKDHHEAPSWRAVPYDEVVTSDFIFIPASSKDSDIISWVANHLSYSLADIGLSVSTGKIVDFRSRDYLSHYKTTNSFPMIYPANITQAQTIHPSSKVKKPQWLHTDIEKLTKILAPSGNYVIVKRFSVKEEKRRITAAVCTSDTPIAFDNKLNYIHSNGEGLPLDVAVGLAKWLNSGLVDKYFRVFSGHTQVNAGDLRAMKFPSIHQLKNIANITNDVDKNICDIILSDK